MKKTTLLLLILLIPQVLAQPIPPGGIIIAGEVTYLGERVDAVVEVEVPSTGYWKKVHSTFSHRDMNYYLSGVKAGSGDYVIVTAAYGGEETIDYVVVGQERSYTLNIELTDDPRRPPDATTTLPETAPPTTSSLKETSTTETSVETTAQTTAQTTIETSAETSTTETSVETTAQTTAQTTIETSAETTTQVTVESEDNSTTIIGIIAILLIIFLILPLIRVLTRK